MPSPGWIQATFRTSRPVIGMVHLPALPSAPSYGGDMEAVVESARRDLIALQRGGVDGVLFCNENDRPYTSGHADPATVAAMAYVIGALKRELTVPFGVDVLWDPCAAVAVAAATGAAFVRGVMTGVYDSDMGLWVRDAGRVARYRRQVGAERVLLFYNINAEFAGPVGRRDPAEVARSVAFSCAPDAFCVSGPVTGASVDPELLTQVRRAAGSVPVFVNTGVRIDNVADYLAVADGAIVGTHFKQDGITWNPVDEERVRRFMEVVRALPGR